MQLEWKHFSTTSFLCIWDPGKCSSSDLGLFVRAFRRALLCPQSQTGCGYEWGGGGLTWWLCVSAGDYSGLNNKAPAGMCV